MSVKPDDNNDHDNDDNGNDDNNAALCLARQNFFAAFLL